MRNSRRNILAAAILLALSVGDKTDAEKGYLTIATSLQNLRTWSEPSEKFKATITMNDNDYVLDLQLTRNVNGSVPVFVESNGKITKWNDEDHEDFAMYYDQDNDASVMVRKGSGSQGGIHNGIFKDGKKMYWFNYNSESRTRSFSDNYEFGTIDSPEELESDYDGQAASITEGIRDLRSGQAYYIELLIVTDYSILKRFEDVLYKKYRIRDRSKAIRDIKYYFLHVASGINARFSSIGWSQLSIRVSLAGIYVAQTPADSQWTEGRGIKDNEGYTEVNKALENFAKWVEDCRYRSSNIPDFDFAALYTKNNLYNGKKRFKYNRRRRINGFTRIGEICQYRKVSINFDAGQYACIQTGAHELGHSLGASDDGDKNQCSTDDQYVMAAYPNYAHDGNIINSLTFSRCSIECFKQHIQYLDRSNKNCLLNYAVTRREVEGQRLKPDYQCSLKYGAKSYFCGGDSICRYMECYNPTIDACAASPNDIAAEFTPCGKHSVCKNKNCVPTVVIPNHKEDFCFFGDYRGILYHAGRPIKCDELASSYTGACYEPNIRKKCCKTCPRIKTSDPGCEYGNKFTVYCNDKSRHDCHDRDVREKCCKTCSGYNGGNGCYGNCGHGGGHGGGDNYGGNGWDHGGGYGRHIRSGTGGGHVGEPDYCIIGDYKGTIYHSGFQIYCDDVASKYPEACYAEHNRKRCCQTCARIKTRDTGCEYGDKSPKYCSGKSRHDCHNSYVREICCKTCAGNNGCHGNCGQGGDGGSQGGSGNNEGNCGHGGCNGGNHGDNGNSNGHGDGHGGCGHGGCHGGNGVDIPDGSGDGSVDDPDCIDEDPSYCQSMPLHLCYDQKSNEKCCKRCYENHRAVDGCQYGDRISGCNNIIRERRDCDSPHNLRKCCETCEKYKPIGTACLNSAAYCSTLKTRDCNNWKTRDECCPACISLNSKDLRCPFGDALDHCHTDDCSDPKMKKQCCTTCAYV